MSAKKQTPNFEPLLLTGESQKEKVDEIMERLKEGIENILTSDKYKEYLTVLSKFPKYSINNCFLIEMQMPEATLVKGYRAWQNDFGRHVRKGEKAIKILAPAPYSVTVEVDKTDKAGNRLKDVSGKPVKTEKKIDGVGFRVVSVFDISQTEGPDLPLPPDITLKDGVDYFNELFCALEKISPVPVSIEPFKGTSAKGIFVRYNDGDGRIVIRAGESELQQVKTLIHELAHAFLEDHQKNMSTVSKEFEAESVAFSVCNYIDLNTSDYSLDYVTEWAQERSTQEIKERLGIIHDTTTKILDALREAGLAKAAA